MSSLEREAADRMRATNPQPHQLIPPPGTPSTQQPPPPPQVNVAPQQVNIAAPTTEPPSYTASTLIPNLDHQDGRVKMEPKPKVHAPPAKNPQGRYSVMS